MCKLGRDAVDMSKKTRTSDSDSITKDKCFWERGRKFKFRSAIELCVRYLFIPTDLLSCYKAKQTRNTLCMKAGMITRPKIRIDDVLGASELSCQKFGG